jgi:hypothetical protein
MAGQTRKLQASCMSELAYPASRRSGGKSKAIAQCGLTLKQMMLKACCQIFESDREEQGVACFATDRDSDSPLPLLLRLRGLDCPAFILEYCSRLQRICFGQRRVWSRLTESKPRLAAYLVAYFRMLQSPRLPVHIPPAGPLTGLSQAYYYSVRPFSFQRQMADWSVPWPDRRIFAPSG